MDIEPSIKEPESKEQYKAEMDRWMLTAFEGDPEAQFKVGILHTNTQFSQADYEQAVYWYRQAARQGHVLAQYNLGHQYLMGVGVNKSESSAMKWWLEAAKQDHHLAQFNIGRAYYLGIGLEQDHRKSKYWFQRAADNKEPKSIEILAKLGWTEGANSKPAAAEFDIASSSTASTKKDPKITSQVATQDVAEKAKTPNPSSQLAIKAARDRRATPDLRSKIIPIDLTKETLVESQPSSEIPLNKKSNTQEANVKSEESPEKILAKDSPELKDSPKLNDSPEPKSSKLIITQTENRLGNLKPDEKLVKLEALNKTVTGNLKKDLPKIKQAAKPLVIESKGPVAIYTDPKIRSVLIAIIDDRAELKIVDAGSQWSSVKSTTGIPVWMHGDYLKLDSNLSSKTKGGSENVMASVTGDNVNTRSVPIVSSGTVVGRLNKTERVSVIEKRNQWYRVIAPKRFIAWVKTQDFNAQALKAKPPIKKIEQQAKTQTLKKTTSQTARKLDSSQSNDQWLFKQKSGDFTLQLGSFVGAVKTKEYLDQINFSQSSDLHQIVSDADGSPRTVFLYGAYKNRKSAEKAKSEINQKQAWVRLLGGLQENRCNNWRQQKPASAELQRYCEQ